MSRATTFEINCPQCRVAVAAKESQVGTRITCPDCLEEFVVIRPEAPSRAIPKATPQPLDVDFFGQSDGGATSLTELEEDATWAADRRQLDALLKVEAPQSGNPPGTDEPYDFTVACPLCGTRQEAKSEQVEHTVRCPDCHSGYTVREPSRKSRRPRNKSDLPDDNEIRLREPESVPSKVSGDRGRREMPVSPLFPVPLPVPKQHSRILTPEDASRDTLARAQKELDEQIRLERPLPGNPMTGGLFRILQHPTVILRIFFIAIGLWLELGAIEAAIHLTSAGPLQQFASVMLRPFALVFGVLFAAHFATMLLAMAQDTSNGRDEMESLPGVNPVEWFFESWPVFVSLFLTLTLAGIAAQAVYSTTGSWKNALLIGVVPAGFLLATLFPVVLLSLLENSTPFSSAVWRGLQLAGKAWFMFIVQALAVVSLGIGLCAVRMNSSSGILNFVACAGLVVASLLFFRLLGRLTWVCQEKLGQEKAERNA